MINREECEVLAGEAAPTLKVEAPQMYEAMLNHLASKAPTRVDVSAMALRLESEWLAAKCHRLLAGQYERELSRPVPVGSGG